MSSINDAIEQIANEIDRAVEKFPSWPSDPLHALAVVAEEFGELSQATLQTVYEPNKSSVADVRTEAIQLAAMAIRFLISLDSNQYGWKEGEQHKQ